MFRVGIASEVCTLLGLGGFNSHFRSESTMVGLLSVSCWIPEYYGDATAMAGGRKKGRSYLAI